MSKSGLRLSAAVLASLSSMCLWAQDLPLVPTSSTSTSTSISTTTATAAESLTEIAPTVDTATTTPQAAQMPEPQIPSPEASPAPPIAPLTLESPADPAARTEGPKAREPESKLLNFASLPTPQRFSRLTVQGGAGIAANVTTRSEGGQKSSDSSMGPNLRFVLGKQNKVLSKDGQHHDLDTQLKEHLDVSLLRNSQGKWSPNIDVDLRYIGNVSDDPSDSVRLVFAIPAHISQTSISAPFATGGVGASFKLDGEGHLDVLAEPLSMVVINSNKEATQGGSPSLGWGSGIQILVEDQPLELLKVQMSTEYLLRWLGDEPLGHVLLSKASFEVPFEVLGAQAYVRAEGRIEATTKRVADPATSRDSDVSTANCTGLVSVGIGN